MAKYILDFFLNNLIIVVIAGIFLLLLAFKYKYVRRFVVITSILGAISIFIYQLHRIDMINNNLYYKTLEFVCLFMHIFEVLMSLIFNVQTKLLENINYYNFLIMAIYTLNILSKFDATNFVCLKFLTNKQYIIKNNMFGELINKSSNNKIEPQNLIKNTVVMIC